jgi:hypothetical protein
MNEADPLLATLAAETRQPVSAAVDAARAALRRQFPNARAILFYGACLRSAEDPPEGLLDFYVLAERYADLHDGTLARLANALLPPNVYYGEMPYRGAVLRWKTATVTFAQFSNGMRPAAASAQFWVRFCQSVRLIYAADAAAEAQTLDALAAACRTALGAVLPLFSGRPATEALWVRLFAETYRTELRPEPPGRAQVLFTTDRAHFERITPDTLAALGFLPGDALPEDRAARAACERAWARRRRSGRLLNAARLVKAAFTFAGAADYAAYKVEKHTGTRVALADWQRRHALLAAPALLRAVWRRVLFRSR